MKASASIIAIANGELNTKIETFWDKSSYYKWLDLHAHEHLDDVKKRWKNQVFKIFKNSSFEIF